MPISFLQQLSSLSLQSVRSVLGIYSNNRNSPPDLDELWSRFTQRFFALFGNGKQKKVKKIFNGLPPHSSLKPSVKQIFYYIVGLLLLGFGLWIGSGFYMVSKGESVVLFRWGHYQQTIDTQGMHWHIPYPMESIESVDAANERVTRIESSLMPISSTQTNSILVSPAETWGVRAVVRYKIQNAAAFLLNNADPQAILIQATQTALRTILITRQTQDITLNDKLSAQSSVVSPNNVEALVRSLKQAVQSELDHYKTGIQISRITLESMQFSGLLRGRMEEDAKGIFEERDRQKNNVQNEAKAQLAHTQSALIKIDENAQRYAWRVVGEAQADAERFKNLLPAYAKAPSIVRERLYRETLQEIYSKTQKVWSVGVQTGHAGKNGMNPLISLFIQTPLQKTETLSGITPPAERAEKQSGNDASSFSPENKMLFQSAVGQNIEQDTSASRLIPSKENTILENTLFPRSRESLRSRERDA